MDDYQVSAVSDDRERTTGELVNDLSVQVKRLIKDEMRLAALEMRRKGIRSGVGAGLVGFAGISALLGAATLVAAAVLAIALVLPGWLAAVIIGAALLLIAGVTALVGTKQIKHSTPPVPEEAVGGVRDDVEAVKEGVRS